MGVLSRQCERARELASLRLDGETSEIEDALLRAHLSRCTDCRVFVPAIEGFTYAVRTSPLRRPGIPFSLPRHGSLRRVQFAFAAAAAVAVVGAGSIVSLLGSPAGHGNVPRSSQLAADDTLAEIRRDALVLTSSMISKSPIDDRIVRVS